MMMIVSIHHWCLLLASMEDDINLLTTAFKILGCFTNEREIYRFSYAEVLAN
ncbi:MAG: hypothetical protein AAF298_03635 [Cyanobacteria bacterium P01_A01_bin.40]